jgi:histidinol-phosphate aminotransferase
MRFPLSAGVLSLQVWPTRTEQEILRKYHLTHLIKLASNENCYGPSPLVFEAIRNLNAHRYPDPQGMPLKETLAEKLGVSTAQIIVGNGSSEIIQMIGQTYLQPREECVTALETFPVYQRVAAAMDANCICVPLSSGRYDLERILASVGSKTRVIFVANPNNPTGTCINETELKDFLDAVPSNVFVVLDEAYQEYQEEQLDTKRWLSRYDNLILLRTFSKVYGLAGLRIGYALSSPEVIADIHRVRLPYSVSLVAQQAAMAALQDLDHVQRCVVSNRQQRNLVQAEFTGRDYSFVPSQTNFVLLKMDVAEALLQKGILVAPMRLFHMPDAVRITLGTAEENAELLNALQSL